MIMDILAFILTFLFIAVVLLAAHNFCKAWAIKIVTSKWPHEDPESERMYREWEDR